MPRVGHLELAQLVAVRASETALDVSEQLGLEQRLGQAGAVDGDKRPLGAPAAVMDACATSSLPVPLSPSIEHLGIGPGDALDLRLEFGHRGAVAHEKITSAPRIAVRISGMVGDGCGGIIGLEP